MACTVSIVETVHGAHVWGEAFHETEMGGGANWGDSDDSEASTPTPPSLISQLSLESRQLTKHSAKVFRKLIIFKVELTY